VLQVAVHTDEQDMAALFLYRKLSKETMQPPLLVPGPAVEATDAEMQVSTFYECSEAICKPQQRC
jgi:hypothetical protein